MNDLEATQEVEFTGPAHGVYRVLWDADMCPVFVYLQGVSLRFAPVAIRLALRQAS